MSDTIPSESEKPIEQENPPAPATPEAQPEIVQEPSLPGAGPGEPQSAVMRSRRGVVSLIFGITSIALAPLVLLPAVEWVGYLGLVATLFALLAARGVLRKRGEADRRERKLAQAGVATGLLGFAVFVALFVVVSIQAAQRSTALVAALLAPPKTFESADFTLSYPGGWTAADTTQKAECKDQAFGCLIWLDAPLGDGRFMILRYPDPGVETAEEFDQAFWAAAQNVGAELVSRQDIQIDQRPAIQRIYRTPASDDPNRRVCVLLITTASDGVLYLFKGVAGDSAACDGHRATFDGITQSFDFKAPLAAEATPAPQVYEGENFTLTYPGQWKKWERPAAGDCTDCPGLVHAYRDGSNIAFTLRHFSVSEKTSEEADASWWKGLTDQTPGLVLESRQPIQLDQRPAIKRIFHDPGSNSHNMGIVLMDGGEAYILEGAALSQEALDAHRADLEGIMDSLRFKHPLQIATATLPRPTATPRPALKSTPAADLSAAKITLADLPATFDELPQPELAKELEAKLAQAFTQGGMSAELANFSTYIVTDAKNPQVFMSFVFYPLDKDGTASFDEAMGQPDLMLQAIAGRMTGQSGKAKVAPLKGSDQLGDNSLGGTVVGDKTQVDVIIMRRGAALSFVLLVYNAAAKPGANVVKLATTLDQRLQDALK